MNIIGDSVEYLPNIKGNVLLKDDMVFLKLLPTDKLDLKYKEDELWGASHPKIELIEVITGGFYLKSIDKRKCYFRIRRVHNNNIAT